jgi:S-disulfanyl-L-cysteine oxidoreductase SoxD
MANQVCRGFLLASLLIGSAVLAFGQDASPSKTVWDGVYKSAQAERGREVFRTICSECHAADLSGGEGPTLSGSVFLGHWSEDNLDTLFAKIRKMPPGGDTLSESTHLDVLAFLLESNGFPAGESDLRATDLGAIRLTEKQGPGAVPNYAAVEAVGCVDRAGTDWILTRGSEPMRNRNPEKPTEEERQRLTGRALGGHTFKLLSPNSFAAGFRIEEHRGEKMAAKGLLIRTGSEQSLNVTWLETLSQSCP